MVADDGGSMDIEHVEGSSRQPLLLGRAEFYAWAEAQANGRYERVNGEVVRVSPERWRHARLKAQIWRAIDLLVAAIPGCDAVIDGMAVEIDDDTEFLPDVAIHFGSPIPADTVVIPNPIVVIEVLSPSTQRIEPTIKADGYFRTQSIMHYLIFRADRREVTLLSRDMPKRSFPRGALIGLEPPGIVLDVDAIYARAEAS
jgi:Uma2 family endonuclease